MADATDSPDFAPGAARVITEVLATHAAALAAYVDRHLPPALRGSFDPGDVVQDVCCEALRSAGRFTPDAESGGRRWLLTVARTRILYLLRRRKACPQIRDADFAAAVEDSVVRLLEELAVYRRTPSESAASHETSLVLGEAMRRLSDDHAAVLRSRYLDGLSARAVAECTGRSPAAVDKLCQRAVAALRVELGRGARRG